jgi:endonuclease V-like protein UPF0215 family
MTITLSFSDTASLKSVIVCGTTIAIFNVSLLVELGACTDRPVLRISVVADAVAARFSHMSAVLVVAGVACLDAVRLRRTAPVR